ncbi:hypothetical protein ACFRI7_33830 [Streptomyces sp. NPDC056716]|uniref:hypothetical protein n=1 Tax=unclassified Streptomyces TaxID=2593676 RepID=UPI0036A834AA
MKLPLLHRMAWLTAVAVLTTMPGASPAAALGASPWQKVGSDAHSGVSGIAYEGRTDDGTGVRVLVVHDNKRTGQPRLSRITHEEGAVGVSPVTWDGPEPSDLEAIEAIPGMPGEYLALASRGIVYRLKVTDSTATVVDHSPLPAIGEGDDFESLALFSHDGRLAALWADRGAGAERPATLYAAPLTFAAWGQPLFGAVTRRAYRAAYPTDAATRHLSDISLTGSGRIIAGSASDAGDNGPFDSAVSDAGRVTVSADGGVQVALAPFPTVLGTFPQYKVEGVECLPGSADAVLGTDDENRGGYVRDVPLCGV